MSQTNKILLTTSTFPRYQGDKGAAFILELSKHLQKQGLEIIVLAPHAKECTNDETIEGIKISRYKYLPNIFENVAYHEGGILPNLKKHPWRFIQVPFFLIAQLWAIKSIVKDEHIQTIHAHWVIPQGFVACLYKKLFHKKIKIVCTSHGSDIHSLKGPFSTLIKKFVLNNSDHITTVSSGLGEEVLKINKNVRTSVVSMGLDLKKFHPDQKDETIRKEHNISGAFLLFVGRLLEIKGVQFLIESMPEILKKHKDAKLMIIGDGPFKSELLNLAALYDVSENIIFVGKLDHNDLPKFYASADILIGPSTKEGFGLVFVEAMASGCFVIASDIKMISDIVIDQKTGFTFKSENPKDLTETILNVLNDKDTAVKIKENARQFVTKNFGWETVSQKYNTLLLNP